MVCIWMWFYNLHLKLAGFSWQVWYRAVTKLIVPKHLEDFLSFRDTFDKDNPVKPTIKQPKSRVPVYKPYKKAGVMAALATLSTIFQHGNMFQLQSDLLLRRNLRKYRNCLGGLDTHRIKERDLFALQAKIRDDQDLFSAVTKNNLNIVSAIVDTGCSFCVTNNPNLFDPGTLEELPSPVELDGIAGGLTITQKGQTNVEMFLDDGELYKIKIEMYYNEQIPMTLLSPQATAECMLRLHQQSNGRMDDEQGFLSQVDALLDQHFRVYHNRMEWHTAGGGMVTIPYDSAFLPHLTIFPEGKGTSSLKAMLGSLHDTNRNLTPLQKVWQLWHIKLGHPSYSMIQKLGVAGHLD